jgi:hypothetical protein
MPDRVEQTKGSIIRALDEATVAIARAQDELAELGEDALVGQLQAAKGIFRRLNEEVRDPRWRRDA